MGAPPTTHALPGAPPPIPSTPLTCAQCGAAVGRTYAPGPGLPPALAPFAGLFTLDGAALASYELGAPALVARGMRVNLTDLPDETLFRYQRAALRRFYKNPRRIVRVLRDHPQSWALPAYIPILLYRATKGMLPGRAPAR